MYMFHAKIIIPGNFSIMPGTLKPYNIPVILHIYDKNISKLKAQNYIITTW